MLQISYYTCLVGSLVVATVASSSSSTAAANHWHLWAERDETTVGPQQVVGRNHWEGGHRNNATNATNSSSLANNLYEYWEDDGASCFLVDESNLFESLEFLHFHFAVGEAVKDDTVCFWEEREYWEEKKLQQQQQQEQQRPDAGWQQEEEDDDEEDEDIWWGEYDDLSSSDDEDMEEDYEDEYDEEDLYPDFFSPVHFVTPEMDAQLRMSPARASKFRPAQQQPHFLLPSTIPAGQVAPVLWRDTMTEIDDHEIFTVGLPPELLTEFRTYFDKSGVVDLVKDLLYSKNSTSNSYSSRNSKRASRLEKKFYEQKKKQEEGTVWTLKDGHKWSVKRADHWASDMVWFDPIDESCYESLRGVLRRGNFQVVMEAARKRLGLGKNQLVVHGLGAIFLSHFSTDPPQYSHLHRDVPNTRGAFYNILVPIYLPHDGDVSSLYIGGHDGICAPIHLQYNVATVVGSDSWHGTGECDYRANQGFRLSMSIWVSEITEETLPVIANDGLAPWPLHGDMDFFRSQKGRSLDPDMGRDPALPLFEDQRPDCHRVKDKCETDLWGVRKECPQTCRVYMGNEEYYTNLESLKAQEEQDRKKQAAS